MFRALKGWLRDFVPGHDETDLQSALNKIARCEAAAVVWLTHREMEAYLHRTRSAPRHPTPEHDGADCPTQFDAPAAGVAPSAPAAFIDDASTLLVLPDGAGETAAGRS